MTFKVIKPIALSDSDFTTPLQTTTLFGYDITGGPHSVGDRVLANRPPTAPDQFNLGAFECVAAWPGGTSFDDPANNPDSWVYLGPSFDAAAYDVQIGVDQQRVVNTLSIRTLAGDWITSFVAPSPITAIAFMNFEGADTLRVDVNSVTIVSEAVRDTAQTNSSFYRYMRVPPLLERNRVFTDLSIEAGDTVSVYLQRSDPTATSLISIGSVVIGLEVFLGETTQRPQWALRSRSVKENNGLTNTVVRRFPGNAVTAETKVPAGNANYVRQVIEALDGLATVFIPSEEHPEFTTYGFIADCRETGVVRDVTFMNIRVEAI